METENGCSHTWNASKGLAAQVNWAKSIRKMLSREPTWDKVPAPVKYDTPYQVTMAAREAGCGGHIPVTEEALGVKYNKAVQKARI